LCRILLINVKNQGEFMRYLFYIFFIIVIPICSFGQMMDMDSRFIPDKQNDAVINWVKKTNVHTYDTKSLNITRPPHDSCSYTCGSGGLAVDIDGNPTGGCKSTSNCHCSSLSCLYTSQSITTNFHHACFLNYATASEREVSPITHFNENGKRRFSGIFTNAGIHGMCLYNQLAGAPPTTGNYRCSGPSNCLPDCGGCGSCRERGANLHVTGKVMCYDIEIKN
jgi:hypothetical protein